MHDFDAITRRVTFRNMDYRVRSQSPMEKPGSVHPVDSGGQHKVIQKACSLSVDFESSALPFHLMQLSGR